MSYRIMLLALALLVSGCASTSRTDSAAAALSCSEILDHEHISNAQHHGSEPYRALVALYRKKKCPAPDFHQARIAAVNRKNIERLSAEDRALSCQEVLVEKTHLDELLEWHSTVQSRMSVLRLGTNEAKFARNIHKQSESMSVRQAGLGSLFEANVCAMALSAEQKVLAKEVHRAPLRYARKRFVSLLDETEQASLFGIIREDETALSCKGLIAQIRFEEDRRVYHLGTASRTIVQGGEFTGTMFGALIFGEAGAMLGMLLDTQTFALAGRMTKREGRLLYLLGRKSCYFEFAVNPAQQEKLTALADALAVEDRSLPCKALRDISHSTMSSLIGLLAKDSLARSRYDVFWQARASGALSDRDAGLMVLEEIKNCSTRA
ncbi:MAG: hypothetical protein OXC42_08245 [Gammaproteobacteria bacterium]|nr:hypothetical protein [Gammaproteobacteria bacterium]